MNKFTAEELQKNNEKFSGKTFSDFTKMNDKVIKMDNRALDKPDVIGSVFLRSTNKLRWSKEVYYDGSTGEHNRILQQLFLDEKGGEHWTEVPVEV